MAQIGQLSGAVAFEGVSAYGANIDVCFGQFFFVFEGVECFLVEVCVDLLNLVCVVKACFGFFVAFFFGISDEIGVHFFELVGFA